jgi:hypothetical protein
MNWINAKTRKPETHFMDCLVRVETTDDDDSPFYDVASYYETPYPHWECMFELADGPITKFTVTHWAEIVPPHGEQQ